MNRKTLSVVIALTLAITMNGTVLAAPASTELKQVQQQKQEIETKVEKLDNQIAEVMKQIEANKKDISTTAANIKSTQSDLESAKSGIKEQQDLFNKRVRSMYINGTDSYLGVILESDNLSDLISKVDTVKKIVGFDEKTIDDLRNKKDAITKKQEELTSENNKLLALKSDNEKKLASFNSDKSEQNKLIANLEEKEKLIMQQDEQEKNMIASAQSQIQQSNAAAARLSRGSTSTSSDSIVAYASTFQGVPYEWGGNGPNTFDCSGFTCYVFAHFGISLPRTSQEQQDVGTYVSEDQLQPGDLVCFGSPAHHVGIYVGDGCFIHAPHTGDVVKISPLQSDFSCGRRIK